MIVKWKKSIIIMSRNRDRRLRAKSYYHLSESNGRHIWSLSTKSYDKAKDFIHNSEEETERARERERERNRETETVREKERERDIEREREEQTESSTVISNETYFHKGRRKYSWRTFGSYSYNVYLWSYRKASLFDEIRLITDLE